MIHATVSKDDREQFVVQAHELLVEAHQGARSHHRRGALVLLRADQAATLLKSGAVLRPSEAE